MSHFKLTSSTTAANVIPVNKYVSEKTGITVYIGEVEGVHVNGSFCFETQVNDDDGLPHALEHLLFLGSKKYPYKNIIESLTISHSADSNTDHMIYSFSTLGQSNLLALLPVYFNHIFSPLLTDEGFTTEIHHINGDGHNGGIMYTEMADIDYTSYKVCETKLLCLMYPNCGYSAEISGVAENIRTSTTIQKIRNFHKKYHHPKNLKLVLTGLIDTNALFSLLTNLEEELLNKNIKVYHDEWVSPWAIVPPVPLYGEHKVYWPADNENSTRAEGCGYLFLSWRGPSVYEPNFLKTMIACDILLSYLCVIPDGIIKKCLLVAEDDNIVSYNITNNKAPILRIEIFDVPVEKLHVARDNIMNTLNKIRNENVQMDMGMIRENVARELRYCVDEMMSNPHDEIKCRCIDDSLYAQNEEDFINRFNRQIHLTELLDECQEYWLYLLRKYFNDNVVILFGTPSLALRNKLEEDEKRRVEAQKIQLGKDGLAEKAKILKEAIAFNERQPPLEFLKTLPKLSFSSFDWYPLKTWSTNSTPCPYIDLEDIPIFTRVNSLQTGFVHIYLVIDTTSLRNEARKWLPLFVNSIGRFSVRRNDFIMPHEQVTSTTHQLTLEFKRDIGFGSHNCFSFGVYSNLIYIRTMCEPEHYEALVDHLYEILYAVDITKERLVDVTEELLHSLENAEHPEGSSIAKDILTTALYAKQSNVYWSSQATQRKFLQDILNKLKANGASSQGILNEATSIFKSITQNVMLDVSTDLDKYTITSQPWKKFGEYVSMEMFKHDPDCYAVPQSNWGGGYIVGEHTMNTIYFKQMCPKPLCIPIEDEANLLVLKNLLSQAKGAKSKLIDVVQTCDYESQITLNEGCVVLTIFDTTDIIKAYIHMKQKIENFAEKRNFDNALLESSKKDAISQILLETRDNCSNVIKQSLLNYIRRGDPEYNGKLLKVLSSVTPESVLEAAARFLSPLMDSTKNKITIVCNPAKIDNLQADFEKYV